MKRVAAAAAGALLLAACQDDATQPLAPATQAPLAAAAAQPQSGDFVAGQVIVRFRPGADAAGIAAAQGGKLDRELLAGVRLVKVSAGRELAVVSALSHNPNVVYAEPDYIRQLAAAPSDRYFGYKWDLHNDGTINNSTGAFVANTGKVDADIDWLEAYEQLGSFSGSAVVGIIDTGINRNHEEFSGGRVLAGYDFLNNDADPADDHGHGTHVAGTAAAPANNAGVPGVAYGANIKILPVKVCDGNGCPSSAIISGIRYAADQGAQVINLSLGGRFGSTAEQDALKYALGKNTLPFCASGNDRASSVSYPAAFPECVAVGATDWNDTRASYSNRGTALDIAAPGGDSENRNGYSYILASGYQGDYVFMAGTSMATPQAAGLGALLHALGVTGASNIRARIEATVDDLGTVGKDTDFGFGRINVYKAINNIR